jgi:predicted enzyme related to lactoylglutathione lyase
MGAKMNADTNALNWFEIPVTDIERATRFYEHAFDTTMHRMDMMGLKMAMFPADMRKGSVGGSLAQSPMHHPSPTGSVIYLNANPDLQEVVSRIEKQGGKIVLPKTAINEETGYMALFTDSEGNTVGLHSNS